MRHKIFLLAGIVVLAGSLAACAQQATPDPKTISPSGAGGGLGGMPGGFGAFPGGRGIFGTVTASAEDHYTIRTTSGEAYTIHFSANTRIMKQSGSGYRRRARGTGQTADQGANASSGDLGSPTQAEDSRQPPQMLKPADIKVGDVITAGGEVDPSARSVGAVFILQMNAEQVQRMRDMQANWGKTWLAGRITGIQDTTITIEGVVDHQSHAISVDENTSFRQRRDSITLADIKPGEELRAEGAPKNGVFLATTVVAMQPGADGQGRPRNRDGAAQPPSPTTTQPQ